MNHRKLRRTLVFAVALLQADRMLRQENEWRPTLSSRDPVLRRWLSLDGSLTAAVRSVSLGFCVRLLDQGWRKPCPDEARLVGVPVRERVWTREVLLGDAGKGGDEKFAPLVFAHSVVAAGDLAAWPWLRGLGNRPLGEVLFQHHGVQRGALAYRRLDARHPLYHSAAAFFGDAVGIETVPPMLWARRSIFTRHGGPLLVSEVFLPELLRR
jgi:chorismate lyase